MAERTPQGDRSATCTTEDKSSARSARRHGPPHRVSVGTQRHRRAPCSDRAGRRGTAHPMHVKTVTPTAAANGARVRLWSRLQKLADETGDRVHHTAGTSNGTRSSTGCRHTRRLARRPLRTRRGRVIGATTTKTVEGRSALDTRSTEGHQGQQRRNEMPRHHGDQFHLNGTTRRHQRIVAEDNAD